MSNIGQKTITSLHGQTGKTNPAAAQSIELANLPWFPREDKINANIAPEVLHLVRKPQRAR